MSGWINITSEDDLGPGQSQLVEIDNIQIAIFNIDGKLFAIENTCTHDGSPLLGSGLPPEHVIDGDQIVCPRHGARFCIRTGRALSPPAYEATTRYPVRIEGNNVQVCIVPIEDTP